MSFVNERIPENQEFDINVFFKHRGEPIERFRWTIDRERDVFLIELRGGGRPEPGLTLTYAMSCQGIVVKFVVEVTEFDAKPPIKDGLGPFPPFDVEWEVVYVRVPEGYEARREEFIDLICEGLEAMGDRTCRAGNRLNNVTVRIQFSDAYTKFYDACRVF